MSIDVTAAPAIRTVAETDTTHVVEGIAYPFDSVDSYGTKFTRRTDFSWSLFPDVDPTATRAGTPRFIRPVTWNHGFTQDIGLARLGGWSPIRMDAAGIHVRAMLDKRSPHYSRVAALLDAGALGLSGGSAEHSVRIDQRSGEITSWPAYELALTPIESNLQALITTRSAFPITVHSNRDDEAAIAAVRGTIGTIAAVAAADVVRRQTG